PARACESEIRGSKGRAEVVRVRKQAVGGTRDPAAQPLEVPLARQVQDSRAIGTEGRDRELVEACGTLAAPEDEQDVSLERQLEQPPRVVARNRPGASGDRPARHPVLAAGPALDREGEKDAARERRREP